METSVLMAGVSTWKGPSLLLSTQRPSYISHVWVQEEKEEEEEKGGEGGD